MSKKWKDLCISCRREVGFFDHKIQFTTGFVCGDCLRLAGIESVQFPEKYLHQEVKDLFDRRISVASKYRETKRVGNSFSVDEKNEMFKLDGDIFDYSNLLSFELTENNKTVMRGGLGSAIVGGLAFGDAGAIVGSTLGRNIRTTSSWVVRISLVDAHKDSAFFQTPNRADAYSCISALEIIADTLRKKISEKNSDETQYVSAADEILKFKKLCDDGIITKDEFEKKKKQLLGI